MTFSCRPPSGDHAPAARRSSLGTLAGNGSASPATAADRERDQGQRADRRYGKEWAVPRHATPRAVCYFATLECSSSTATTGLPRAGLRTAVFGFMRSSTTASVATPPSTTSHPSSTSTIIHHPLYANVHKSGQLQLHNARYWMLRWISHSLIASP
jgi:hypothetical protein